MPFPYTFTFYSYKGGVGRSLALLNTAYVLASWGRHVLIVDMDLEAPGVGGFLTRLEELPPPKKKDLVDLLALALRSEPTELPPVSQFIRSVLPEKLKSLTPQLGEIGRLDVLAPDTDRDYTQRLTKLALQELSRDRIIDLGQKLHAYFKNQRVSLRPLGIEDFEEPIETPYDYILVDSRTGFTEIGGLCVGPLSDRLVVLTGLNDQNIAGTMHFLREVGITPAPRQDTQPWDDADSIKDPEAAPGLGPKPTIVVATPVPSGEIEFKRQRLAVLEKAIGIKPLRISYHPHLALMEEIFVRDFTDEPPAADYLRLAVRITSQVLDSAGDLSKSALNTDGQKPVNGPQLLRLLAQRPEDAAIINFRAFSGDLLAPKWRRRIAATLSRDRANRAAMLTSWAGACLEEGRLSSPELRDQFYLAAAAKCIEAIHLKADYASAFNIWGNSLAQLAATRSDEAADQLFAQAFTKYSEAIRLQPDLAAAFNNWGNSLSDLAETKSGDFADQIFSDALAKYEEATRLNPRLAVAFYNWGNTHSALARAKSGQDATDLFAQAEKKYADAARLEPSNASAFYGWGNALAALARASVLSGTDTDQLYFKASKAYAEAARLNPSHADAFNNWGVTLLDLAKTKSGEIATELLAEAREKLQSAGPTGVYNLACLEAFQGNAAAAVDYLRQASSLPRSPTLLQLDIDTDLDSIRTSPEFLALVAELRQKQALPPQ